MMVKGVSLIVSSRDHALNPSVMRAVGSRIDDGGRRITAYLARNQSRQLLADLSSSGRLAAVFSQPTSHLTVQFKSRRFRIREATPDDSPYLAQYLASMEDELGALGYPRVLAKVMLAHQPQDLVAVEFEPDEAFDQTPGPNSGQAMGLA
ncbi:MAG: hypothetical protein KF871_00720 [Hydrogenophaga sp.]|nr:hypothetical protein [Hydrogenophaga sp.]